MFITLGCSLLEYIVHFVVCFAGKGHAGPRNTKYSNRSCNATGIIQLTFLYCPIYIFAIFYLTSCMTCVHVISLHDFLDFCKFCDLWLQILCECPVHDDRMSFQVLIDFQENPKAAQEHLKNPQVMHKIQKLVSAGIVQMR